MSLINEINVDFNARVVYLNSISGVNLIENIQYLADPNQITISTRSNINITANDFIKLIEQIKIFNTAILSNFPTNSAATAPFSSINSIEEHDTINNRWNLTENVNNMVPFVKYSAHHNTALVHLFNRAANQTIDFPEWIYLLYALSHYQISVRNFFGI